jgi:mRNA interferase RelE/StbE
MAYTVEFTQRASREFRKLPPEAQRRIAPKIDALEHNPRPHGVEKIDGNVHRIRVGDYRVIYEIRDSVLMVLVVHMGHRREVYRKL